MYALGIDLGTTNTVVSVFRNGRKETIKINGQSVTPSFVSFRKNIPEPLVGSAAKSRLGVDPSASVGSAKRFMGDRTKTYQIHGRSYSPVDISAHVLKHVIEGAKASLNQQIWDVVITVPAYFDEAQRADTRRAGEQAGLNVLRLLPEPSAAAISYGFDKGKDQTIMVYDLGGGTFDISILKVSRNDFEVLAVSGDSRLGGDDFDDAIVTWVANRFKKDTGVDIMASDDRDMLIVKQRLKEQAERAKKDLSSSRSAEIMLPEIAGHSLDMEISRETFNDLIKPKLRQTVEHIKQVLRESNMTAEDIDRVVLVGGSTRIPAVKEIVTNEIKEPYCDEDPDEAVAWGAAIVASSLSAPEEEDLAPINIKEVTAHSLGVGLMVEGNYQFRPLISRNSRYPCEGGVLGTTLRPRQEAVQIEVFRGEKSLAVENTNLGELVVPVKKPNEFEIPVVALFKLDQDGILFFQAVDIPLDRLEQPLVKKFVEDALYNEGTLDTKLLEELITTGSLPKPESITIDPK